jgi:hypothetical protein
VTSAAGAPADWPGKRLGLPLDGPRSVARLGRRLLGICLDWALAMLVSWLLVRTPEGTPDGFVTLGIFALVQILMIVLVGATPGHLLTRMRLVPVTGGRLAWWRPNLRTALLCVVIPAVIFDRDQRGLHDRWAGTLLVVV